VRKDLLSALEGRIGIQVRERGGREGMREKEEGIGNKFQLSVGSFAPEYVCIT